MALALAVVVLTLALPRGAVPATRRLAALPAAAGSMRGADRGRAVSGRRRRGSAPGRRGRGGRVVVTKGIVEMLGPAERAVLFAHEQAHLRAVTICCPPPPTSPPRCIPSCTL
ncbi:M48 family metalloprotease [Streptomyces sp. NRRL F-2580]|uniref:M48 family metalloprotease n=1 Tax=Streptomyces sp. NRRL F-2580 TaxID=1463841 RepID=UPI0004C9C477|nr:M48 family metalloprotease [Streptomyces sp. NRRL F-2580]